MINARRLYAFALGREPESDAFVRSFATFDFLERVRAFFGSAEFYARAIAPVLEEHSTPWLGAQPPKPLLRWAARRLGLSAETAFALARARTWSEAYLHTFSDVAIQELFGSDHPVIQSKVLEGFRKRSLFVAGLDDVQTDRVKGWILNMEGNDTPLSVEVWIDGAFVAAGPAKGFRPDIQARWGGLGLAGFDIFLPPRSGEVERPVLVEVREARTRWVVGAVTIDRSPPDLSLLENLAAQIADLRAAVDRVEREMPAAQRSLGFPLRDYGSYYDRWLRDGPRELVTGDVFVVLDALGAEPRGLDEAASSLIEQGQAKLCLIILADEENRDIAEDVRVRASWLNQADVRVVITDYANRANTLSELLRERADDSVVVLTKATEVLAPNALYAFSLSLLMGAACAYADEDRFADQDMALDLERRAHVSPAFKPGFDPDLLAQICYVGETVAFRARALNKVSIWSEAGPLYAAHALFRIALTGDRVVHLPRVLATRRQMPNLETWPSCVADALQIVGQECAVESHKDILGAEVRGAVRWRYPVPQHCRAAVIVPTRDRIDLIKPCLDSLISNRSANRTEMEIIVVDHNNADPDAVSYLKALADEGEIRLAPFDGAFNWALMNNFAANQTDAEVLVFLNDDTVVVSPDWLDELVSQALRPGVGVVGCRLVYSDGTLQHAGFILRDTSDAFVIHDGVGVAGSDGGYLGRYALLHQTVAVTGACMAVSREIYRGLGGFDAANFPIEANDVDFCFRAAAAGLAVLYDPYATLYHLESKTRGVNPDHRRSQIAQKAMALLWNRWGRHHGPDRFFNAHFDRSGQPFAHLRPLPRFSSDSVNLVKAPI